jgi:hypothetical protein
LFSPALAVDFAGEVTDPVLEVKGVAVRTQLQYQPPSWRALGISKQIYPLKSVLRIFDTDPDPNFHFDADPDSFPDLDSPMLQYGPLRLQPFHFDADPDPAFHFDPDSTFPSDADPDLASQNDTFTLMRIRILLFTLIRIVRFPLMRIRI